MFDSYPRLIAAFRALHSLLMPRHPPCAHCSLTTRIERSSAPALAGRSGETLESNALPWISDQVRCGFPPEPATPRINDFFSLIALGERFRDVRAHASSAFFQDANYHDQIVALFRLGFPVATDLRSLTEPLTVTRRIIMQKARRHALLTP